jgi:hypothetical protein
MAIGGDVLIACATGEPGLRAHICVIEAFAI